MGRDPQVARGSRRSVFFGWRSSVVGELLPLFFRSRFDHYYRSEYQKVVLFCERWPLSGGCPETYAFSGGTEP